MLNKLAGCIASGLALIALAVPATQAQDASRPIQIVVGYAPGGPLDSIARTLAPRMAEALKQNVVVDNKPGATGIIANQFVTRSAPDGNTLVINGITQSILPALKADMPYDTIKDFTPIALIGFSPLIIVTAPGAAFKSLPELIQYTKANPGTVAFASGGSGSSMHLAMEMLKQTLKLDMVHVPYKGSIPALTDVMEGRVHLVADVATTALPRVKQGQLRALAVTGPKRMADLPDVPTVIELGYPQADFITWWGIFGPAGIPPATVQRLSAALQAALKDPEVQRRYATLGGIPTYGSSAELGKTVETDIARFKALAKDVGIRMD